MNIEKLLAPFFELRVSDVLDILLVAALVYTVFASLRRTQASQVAAGIITLGIVYFVASALGFQLTAWLFQGFFAVFLVILVVIFQEELRQLFERIASWSPRGWPPNGPAEHSTDVLVQVCGDLAREQVGALIVIPGRRPISRYVQGGVELNGRVSLPLLRSLFDPHSPGHDGAVLLQGGRITRFAAQKPGRATGCSELNGSEEELFGCAGNEQNACSVDRIKGSTERRTGLPARNLAWACRVSIRLWSPVPRRATERGRLCRPGSRVAGSVIRSSTSWRAARFRWRAVRSGRAGR
jgi:DNA integrity scanning protein DisA with diadenylate cyclase activity